MSSGATEREEEEITLMNGEEEREDQETIPMQLMELFPDLSCSVVISLCEFLQRFYPTEVDQICAKLQKNHQTIVQTKKGTMITTADIDTANVDKTKETNEFYTTLLYMFLSVSCMALYYTLIDLTKNDKGGFDYNVSFCGGTVSLIVAAPIFAYGWYTEGWDAYSLPNLKNAFLSFWVSPFIDIFIFLGLSYDISPSLANVIVIFFSFPLIMIIKLINGNKDMTPSSYWICTGITLIALQVTFHFNMLTSSPFGLTFLFLAAICNAFTPIVRGKYSSKIKVGKVVSVFWGIFPYVSLMWIFGIVQELIKEKSLQEIFAEIPFDMIILWVCFGLVLPLWIFVNTELCKKASFQYCICGFIAIFIISIIDSTRDFVKAGTEPDLVFILAVIAMICGAIAFMLNMKSALTKLKAMQESNGELKLERIERIVNLHIIDLAQMEIIDANEYEFRIPLLKKGRNEESFCHKFNWVSEENLETLKIEILKKYSDAKERFVDDHDFEFFGMDAV